eukprot:7532130-Lingulodinium_polyedra.AAC.1
MTDGLPCVGIVDAKSVFDVLTKNTSGSKRDRRTAVELCMCRDDLQRTGSVMRWLPHSRMVSDAMTKSDISKANAALTHLLSRGRLTLRLGDDEGGSKDRSRAASFR